LRNHPFKKVDAFCVPHLIRDIEQFSGRNTSMGALVEESTRVFNAIAAGESLAQVKQRCIAGDLLSQRTEKSRRRIWASLTHRYFEHEVQWAIHEIVDSVLTDQAAFIDLLYLHYALRDRIVFELVTGVLYPRRKTAGAEVTKPDIRNLLDLASTDQPQIAKWTEATRAKLANSTLTALRDFGILNGKVRKFLAPRQVTDKAVEHLLHILVAEGQKGKNIITDVSWRLFFLTEHDVAAKLAILAQQGKIRFEKAGSTVVLETPSEWEAAA